MSSQRDPATDGGCVEDGVREGGVETAREPAVDTRSGYDRPLRRAITHVTVVAGVEYRLAIRSLWALALAGLFAVFGAMLLTMSGSPVGPEGVQRV
ncbi:MAG: ABC transporter permease, partial [Haloferacaceae archaeon]